MYQLCGTTLSGVEQEKYLGVLISQDLSWGPHIQKVSISANQKLGFLRRNLRGSPRNLKKMAYVTIVRPSLEYASTIWDPHQANHISMLEKTQRRAARWISGDYRRHSSVTSMLGRLELEPLEERRRIARLTFLYKILHEEVAVPDSQLGITRNPRVTRGNYTTDKLMVPQCSTTELRQHFVARSIPQWNRLPEAVTSADSVPSFKRQLQGLPPRP